ncbi:YciI family protein [Kribbella sp. CA-253562]|uniref:YciI family protein n=1 Tax=Kribbella sp. CA-253562 TaxID=3239942 RepID=UPI003D8CCF62
MRFDRHTVVLLTLRPDAPVHTDAEASALQDAHLAYRAKLVSEGLVLAGGPLVDQDDDRYRGWSIWSVDQQTARIHAEADPAVRAGRLAVDVMTWMMPSGTLHFAKARAPESAAETTAGD